MKIKKKGHKNKREIITEIKKDIKSEYGRSRYKNMFRKDEKKLKEYRKSYYNARKILL